MKTKSLTSSEMEFWQDAFVRFLGPSLPVSGSAAEADKALAEWQKRARMVRSAGSGFVTEGPSETCPECRHDLDAIAAHVQTILTLAEKRVARAQEDGTTTVDFSLIAIEANGVFETLGEVPKR